MPRGSGSPLPSATADGERATNRGGTPIARSCSAVDHPTAATGARSSTPHEPIAAAPARLVTTMRSSASVSPIARARPARSASGSVRMHGATRTRACNACKSSASSRSSSSSRVSTTVSPSRNEAASARVASAATDSGVGPVPSNRMMSSPTANAAASRTPLPSARASVPSRSAQDAPRAASSARSARTATCVSPSSRRSRRARRAASSARHCTASAPWPGAGGITWASRISPSSTATPSLRRPASARTAASYSPSRTLRSRVSTFPRISRVIASRRRARRNAARRGLDVPTTAPSGSEARPPREVVTSTSRGSSRSGTAAINRPSRSAVGRSFRECTATSISRRSSASSIVATNAPSPSVRIGRSLRSPAVRRTRISTSSPRRDATSFVCASASALPRVPITTVTARSQRGRTRRRPVRVWSEAPP